MKVYQRFNQGWSKIQSRLIKGSIKVFKRFYQGLSMVQSRFIKGSIKVYQRFNQGWSKVRSRLFKGSIKVYQRFNQGSIKVQSRFIKGSFKGFFKVRIWKSSYSASSRFCCITSLEAGFEWVQFYVDASNCFLLCSLCQCHKRWKSNNNA